MTSYPFMEQFANNYPTVQASMPGWNVGQGTGTGTLPQYGQNNNNNTNSSGGLSSMFTNPAQNTTSGWMPPRGFEPPGYTAAGPRGTEPPSGMMPPSDWMPPSGWMPPRGFEPPGYTAAGPRGTEPPSGWMPPRGWEPPGRGRILPYGNRYMREEMDIRKEEKDIRKEMDIQQRENRGLLREQTGQGYHGNPWPFPTTKIL